MPRVRRIVPISLSILLGIFTLYNVYFFGKIYPNIKIAGVGVSDMVPETASLVLAKSIVVPEKIKLISEENSFELSTAEVNLQYDYDASTRRAYDLARTGNLLFDFEKRISLLFAPQDIGLILKLDEEKLSNFISIVAGQVSVDPVFPSATISGETVNVERGRAGSEIDTDLLRAEIGEALSLASSTDIIIPLKQVDPSLTDEEASIFKQRAEKFLGKSLTLTFEFDSFKLVDEDIVNLLDAKEGLEEEALKEKVFEIAKKINREPQDAKFAFESGKVTEFLPAKDGIELDSEAFKEKLNESLNSLAESSDKSLSFEIPVVKTPPQTATEKVNDLGIKELIGRGSSKFRGSIPSRIHNIQLASSTLNGLLIAPGETFSFNNALGDVSKFTGYQEAYVIREGKTVLGDGGGVCQVSTTFFRAALNAGLPITERQAHAYRVGYYEQDSPPGLDATVYGPSPDLKIKNDTPAHILIQAKADTKNLTLIFELYGTNDGRVSTVTKPVTTSVTPPGEDLYIDDPSLPAGTIKQTEHKANGARVTFNYLVTRNGEEIYKKTFISNYRPWQAVYLRGTAPVQ